MNSFQIINFEDYRLWDNIVTSFKNYEVYYLHGYVMAFYLHKDGIPKLIYYHTGQCRSMNVVMVRDIATVKRLDVKPDTLYDLVTPYGYGGMIVEGTLPEDFVKEYQEFCIQHHYVSEFTRISPFNKVEHPYGSVISVGATVAMDTTSREIINANLTSKNRNMIRKAQKNGVQIKYGLSKELFEQFLPMYNATMDKDQAENYYYFDDKFYESILTCLPDNALIFYAEYQDKPIAMSIILFVNGHVHYHLSCSSFEYRNLAPTNLLLYEVANWASANGYSLFHLGGGVGGKDTGPLYEFKKSFNRYHSLPYEIGEYIIDKPMYKILTGKTMNKDSDFFPIYRA